MKMVSSLYVKIISLVVLQALLIGECGREPARTSPGRNLTARMNLAPRLSLQTGVFQSLFDARGNAIEPTSLQNPIGDLPAGLTSPQRGNFFDNWAGMLDRMLKFSVSRRQMLTRTVGMGLFATIQSWFLGIPHVLKPLFAQTQTLVVNLTSLTGRSYLVGVPGINARPYSDRSYPFLSLPNFLLDSVLIRTPNDDKAQLQIANVAQFTVSEESLVYIAYQKQVNLPLPEFLADFQESTEQIRVQGSGEILTYTIFYKKVASGQQVELKGNYNPRGASWRVKNNYFVFVKKYNPIENLMVNSNGEYQLQGQVAVGAAIYTDDSTKSISVLPQTFKTNTRLLMTPTADRTESRSDLIRFTVPEDTIVYIPYYRGTSPQIPDFLKTFRPTSLTVDVNNNGQTLKYKTYYRIFKAGEEVVLGGMAGLSPDNYFVLLKPFTVAENIIPLNGVSSQFKRSLFPGLTVNNDSPFWLKAADRLTTALATFILPNAARFDGTPYFSFIPPIDVILRLYLDSDHLAILPGFAGSYRQLPYGATIEKWPGSSVQLHAFDILLPAGVRYTLPGNFQPPAAANGDVLNYLPALKAYQLVEWVASRTPASYSMVEHANIGSKVYTDANDVIVDMPDQLKGLTLTQTADADRAQDVPVADAGYAEETVDYFVYQQGAAAQVPDFLKECRHTGLYVTTTNESGGSETYEVYYRINKQPVRELPGNRHPLTPVDQTRKNYFMLSKVYRLIENLTVHTPLAYKYKVIKNRIGAKVYADREYTIRENELQAEMEGAAVIQAANDDKWESANTTVEFDLETGAAVYVAYQPAVLSGNAYPPPDFLNEFRNTGKKLRVNGNNKIETYDIYVKIFPRGHVSLGGNRNPLVQNSAVNNNCIVFAKELSEMAPSTTPATFGISSNKLYVYELSKDGLTMAMRDAMSGEILSQVMLPKPGCTGISLLTDTAAFITLEWDYSGVMPTGFKIYLDQSDAQLPADEMNTVPDGSFRQMTYPVKTSGPTRFWATAYNQYGESGHSDPCDIIVSPEQIKKNTTVLLHYSDGSIEGIINIATNQFRRIYRNVAPVVARNNDLDPVRVAQASARAQKLAGK
ncbi:MAG: hypothetical protein NC924_06310 [Candidatus Omnitrophica bacterium]|nr:hypothetical protein [Candidatus Omnitrophota bacterium]